MNYSLSVDVDLVHVDQVANYGSNLGDMETRQLC